ncbi:LLM class flavin-dependent oxidoreductase [Sphaerisporangium sp. NPDC051017]|uniref:LLM class flavin-dependent oxidoreductase n=1 Tax=Sphaerisporangium sp. NPDC051017 TaxID=3154636 RepID=UPI00342290C0
MSERTILFGFRVPVEVGAVAEVLRCAALADRAGLDLFATSDHPYYGDHLEAYATLGFVLGRTTTIAGVTTVTNTPTRSAPLLARTLTSLSALSDGRVVYGVGAGGVWDDITSFGAPRLSPSAAVRAMEESIHLVRALSGGGEPVTFDGEFYKISGITPAPVPAPPVWTGSVGPKSLAVTGRLADGWVPGRASDWLSERYRASRPLIDEAAAAAGRDPSEIATIYYVQGHITDTPRSVTRDAGRWAGGSVGQWVESLTGAVLEHGASGFILFPPGGASLEGTLMRWAEEIVPAVREAVEKPSGR